MRLDKVSWPLSASLIMLLIFQLHEGAPSVFLNWAFSNLDSQVSGKVIRSEFLVGTRASDVYRIRYSYVVDGKFYASSVVNGYSFASRPREMVVKYPVGREVLVYYDSGNPRYAVLEKGPLGWTVALKMLAVLGVLVWPLFVCVARFIKS